VAPIKDVINKFNLKPVAALITHGHLDHTFSVLPFSNSYKIPTFIHSTDRKLLANPFRALQPGGVTDQLMQQFGVTSFSEPDEVVELSDSQVVNIAGLEVVVSHAPGHTAGSAMFTVASEYLLSGDVLFAGSIGRTDMPTGSAADMRKTLINKVLPLDDELVVLPGHGPQTTMGRERKNNPYLQNENLNFFSPEKDSESTQLNIRIRK
jgi:glyoxylase-like metal-dependent hydrolase (beta-lactamase superfamily II)